MRVLNSDELFCMEVINLCDGARLGCPTSLEVDVENGCVTALLLPKDAKLFGFHGKDMYRIPWKCLQCVGEDTILVKMTVAELTACICKPHSGRKKFF